MESLKTKRVGFVATGDEITNGDILNSNTQYFAQQLKLNNIMPGKQITVSDNQAEIADAILFLAKDHDCIITIGGLGPTEDDLTRFALSQALNLPLTFYEKPWQWITDRFAQYKLEATENNRQQALLPEGSEAIPNPNGTACACYIHQNETDYFMLPGPPNECFPIFDEVVLKKLLSKNYAHPTFRKSWMLFGTSESKIADRLEKLDRNGCELGYRVSYPYLEIKLKSGKQSDLEKTAPLFEEALKDDAIGEGREKASEKLYAWLKKTKHTFLIDDQATGGRLESLLLTPETAAHFHHPELTSEPFQEKATTIKLAGLEGYWKKEKSDYFSISLTINDKTQTLKVPSRQDKTLLYACELVCLKLLSEL